MFRQLTKSELRAARPSRNDYHDIPKNEVYVVLDNLKCSHNIGTIFRLADALLVRKVYLCGNTVNPFSKKVKKGSLGSERWIDIEQHNDAIDVIRELKDQGVRIIAAEIASGSVDYRIMKWEYPLCIVLGREDQGVSDQILKSCDAIVHLPVFGMTNSLNVSTVAAVLMYEVIRHFKMSSCENRTCKRGPVNDFV